MKQLHAGIAMALLAASLWNQPAAALINCQAAVDANTGAINVSGNTVGTNLTWGTALGAESSAFSNAATCISGAKATNCQLGPSGTLAQKTGPASCTIYLHDAFAGCSAWVKGCSPGVRLRDASFAANDPRIEAVSLEDSGATLRFTNVNVQVVSGSNATDGPVNGKGNIIVGYNANTLGNAQGGSHNLVIGDEHTFTSFAGAVVGNHNAITDEGATVTGGQGNTASGEYSSVSGGQNGVASGEWASVSGGDGGVASALWASVSGGSYNYADDNYAWVAGGASNTAGLLGSAVGGFFNNAGYYAVAAGGLGNVATGGYSTATGGYGNRATGNYAATTGGYGNLASGYRSVMSGGNGHAAPGEDDWAAGDLFQDD